MNKKSKKWVVLLVLATISVACQANSTLRTLSENRAIAATKEAERYPWAVYDISIDSQQKLCDALELSTDDEFCQSENRVNHWDVYKKIEEIFPPNETKYAEVESKLGNLPHVREESRHPNGHLVSLRYAYQLTEFEGACVYFFLDLQNEQTVVRIMATTRELGSPQRTKCGPADYHNGSE